MISPQETICPVLSAMRNHSASAKLQTVASSLLMSMCNDDTAARDIGEEGGVQDVLAALRAYPSDPEVRVLKIETFTVHVCIDFTYCLMT